MVAVAVVSFPRYLKKVVEVVISMPDVFKTFTVHTTLDYKSTEITSMDIKALKITTYHEIYGAQVHNHVI